MFLVYLYIQLEKWHCLPLVCPLPLPFPLQVSNVLLFRNFFHSVMASQRETLPSPTRVCAFIIPHPAFCAAQRGEETDCHTSCHIQAPSPVRSARYKLTRLRWRMRRRHVLHYHWLTGTTPSSSSAFPPPDSAGSGWHEKSRWGSSFFFYHQRQQPGPGCRKTSSLHLLCVPTEIACLLVVTAALLITWGISINSFDVRGKAGNVLGELISTCYISPLFSLDLVWNV